MSGYLQWLVLTALTGSPIGSAIGLLVFWLLVDRFTLGILPDPFRWLARLRREGVLKRVLAVNPHDRRSRAELADLLVQRSAYAQAVDVLRPNLEAGDDGPSTVLTMGTACINAGFRGQGEKLLAHLDDVQPGFRVWESALVLGRARLAAKDFAGARDALERLVRHRSGTIEGRVLLARALDGVGEDGAGALMRDAAWAEYKVAPRFQRRKERLWAWRARPSRPLLYALVLLAVLLTLGSLVPKAWPSMPAAVSDA